MSEQSPIKEENNNEISESIENVTETQNQNSEKKFESQSNKNLNESENNKESQNIKQEDDPESKKKKEKQEQSLDGKNKKIEKEKEEELIEEELSDNDGSTSVVTNSSETPETDNSNDKTPEKKGRPIFSKEKESILLREKRKQQEKKDKNRVRYLTEEEINLAFKWFTKGDSVISSRDIKECFDTFFTDLSRNDKKYYVSGNIKNDTRHLVNIKEEKIQSEMFSTTQTISSLKKMLLRYPFKIKDYDNAFSILCEGNKEDILSEKTLNKYIDIFKDNEVPVKNTVDKILRCFDKDKDGQLGISDLFKMKSTDLKKITDDYF